MRHSVFARGALNPTIEILLRRHSDEEAALLTKENRGTVFFGEQELATAMSRHVLSRLEELVNPPGTRG